MANDDYPRGFERCIFTGEKYKRREMKTDDTERKKLYIVFVCDPNIDRSLVEPIARHIFSEKRSAESYARKTMEKFVENLGTYTDRELEVLNRTEQLAAFTNKYLAVGEHIYRRVISSEEKVRTIKTKYGCHIKEAPFD